MNKANYTPKSSFKRLPDDQKLCRSELLDCDICFDTGSTADIIPKPLLEQFIQKGFVVEDAEGPRTFVPADGVPITFESCKWLTLPLSLRHWYRSVFQVSDVAEGRTPGLAIGRRLLKKCVIEYTRDSINLLDDCPEAYSDKVPLEEEGGSYYVNLLVNGREHRCYLDTGHSDPISLPERESVFAISPIHKIEDELVLHGRVNKVVDLEEERACLQIGGITRHGPIVYADYYKHPCWFNPAKIFAEFVIDLSGGYIAFNINK